MPAQVAHLTSVHTRFDTRIFLKQCRSLAAHGHDVSLVVADGKGDAARDGVRIFDVGKAKGRLDRMVGTTRRVYRKALELDADVFHLHDPELIPVGLALKRRGKMVIFDAHEDLPRQVMSKPYLSPYVRKPLATAISRFERFACPKFDGVVTATPSIGEKFSAMGAAVTVVKNYPLLGELESPGSGHRKERAVCYVGGISEVRGILPLVRALGETRDDTRLLMAGSFGSSSFRQEVMAEPGWSRVEELGFCDREGVRNVLRRSMAGIVTLFPTPNHVESLPIKMFEYMSAGLPVIASDFPLWREIVVGNECGLCVDPLDPAAIAAAIDALVDDPARARQLGENGRRAVEERYNWGIEEKKLLALYDRLANRR